MAENQGKRPAGNAKNGSSAPNRLVLLVTIVQKGKGTFFSDYLQQTFGANLQLAIVGNGTAEANLVEFLGLKDKRSVIFSVVREDKVDLILIMSVEPGFGGQKFITHSLEKVRQLRQMIERTGSHALIEVDGGVNKDTAVQLAQAGTDVLVAGSYVFGAPNPYERIDYLKNIF